MKFYYICGGDEVSREDLVLAPIRKGVSLLIADPLRQAAPGGRPSRVVRSRFVRSDFNEERGYPAAGANTSVLVEAAAFSTRMEIEAAMAAVETWADAELAKYGEVDIVLLPSWELHVEVHIP